MKEQLEVLEKHKRFKIRDSVCFWFANIYIEKSRIMQKVFFLDIISILDA